MTTSTLANVSVATQANVYFDGQCVSHSLTLADGRKCSVGVVMPGTLTFGTNAAEVMEGTAGACEYRLAGSEAWVPSGAGDTFSVPANSKFDIRVTGEPYSYICHYA